MAKKRANGERNIRKRKDGRWEGRYTAGYDQDRKRIIKNVLGRTQAEVKAKLSVAIMESQQLDVSRSGEYTVAEWLRLWFELYARPNIRPSTAGYYRRAMEEYTIPRIGTTKLNKLTSREIQKLYKNLLENGRLRKKQRKKHPGISGSTVRGVHIMLHSPLDRAVKERLLIRNPADSCVVPKVQHQEMKTLQPEDLKNLPGRSRAAECSGSVLSGVGQRHSQRRAGGPAMGGLGRGATDYLRQQTGHER